MAVPDLSVNRTIAVGEPPDAAMQRYAGELGPWFARGAWYITDQSENTITYGRTYFHTWQIVVAILLFPLGLIGLLAEKKRSAMTATFLPLDGGSTTIRLTGNVPPKVSGQLADQLDAFDPAKRDAGSPD